jgi:predicted ATPase
LIGRERECEVLRGAVVRVVEGGSAFVLVVGEPGIGKSTLLATLADLARESGLAVGFGRGQSAGAAPPWPWRSALESVAAERGQSAGKLSRPLDDARVERHAQLESGGTERFAIFEQFAEHLSVFAAQGPIALLLDDLQRAEVSALRLLSHLIHRPSLPGVLIAGALRTTEPLPPDADELVSEVLAHPITEVLEVSGFDEREIAA